MLTSTDRYIARLIALPLFATLIVSAMLLVLDKMLRLFRFVAEEGGPVSVVWRMLANLLPEYLSLGIPIGLMLGILLAFRKIALSSELDVFKAVGMSYGRLLRVPYMFAIGLALVNLAVVGFVQPYARYAYEGLRFELRSGALGASIKVGEFARFGNRLTMRIERSEKGGQDLYGIFVRAAASGGKTVSVTAERGTFWQRMIRMSSSFACATAFSCTMHPTIASRVYYRSRRMICRLIFPRLMRSANAAILIGN